MSDRSPAVSELLERAAEEAGLSTMPGPDWGNVLARAQLGANGAVARYSPSRPRANARFKASTRRRRLATLALVLLVAGAVIATAVGSGAYDRFSSWLSSIPGVSSSESEQESFNRANQRAPFGFEFSRELREVNRVAVDGAVFRLLGFTAKDSKVLCLRLAAIARAQPVPTGCSTVGSLALAPSPASLVVGEYAGAWTPGQLLGEFWPRGRRNQSGRGAIRRWLDASGCCREQHVRDRRSCRSPAQASRRHQYDR